MTEKLLVPDIGDFENVEVIELLVNEGQEIKKNDPVITVKSGKENTYCHEVEILGNSKVIYGGNDKPLLNCGARVVIETESDVRILR